MQRCLPRASSALTHTSQQWTQRRVFSRTYTGVMSGSFNPIQDSKPSHFLTFGATHTLFHRYPRYWWVPQTDPGSSDLDIQALGDLIRSKYRRRRNGRKKVSRWILSYVMHPPSQNPPLPTSAVVDCPSVVAIDLGCDVSRARSPWLNNRAAFTLVCWGRFRGTQREVIKTVRALGNIEILKSYMLLVWSERDHLGFLGLHDMYASIQEDFSRIGMERHRGRSSPGPRPKPVGSGVRTPPTGRAKSERGRYCVHEG